MSESCAFLQVMVDMSQPELEVERETFPACTYAALEFCQRHLAAVKNQLVQVILIDLGNLIMAPYPVRRVQMEILEYCCVFRQVASSQNVAISFLAV